MANIRTCNKHNMIACVEKTAHNADFYQIIDYLTGCSINYSLLVDPDLIGPWLQQFWATASLRVINEVPHIRAMVAGKRILISEETIRADLLFDDADGVDCFPKQVIWDSLRDIGYEGNLAQLTFSKPLFSPQWKYLVHVLLHCLSPKSTSWEQFGTNIASALVGLATNQKFNFSLMIMNGMLGHISNGTPFLMYPRFIQLFLNKQLEGVTRPQNFIPSVTLPSKVFTFMRKHSPKFSCRITPLTPPMLEVVTALAAEEAHSTSPHSRAASSPRDAQGTPTQSAAQASISQGTADLQGTAKVQGTADLQGTAEVQGTANFQGTAETQGAADIPHSPTDYTPTDASQTSGGDEGLLDLYALNREVRRLKKQTLSQAKQIIKLKTKLKKLSKFVQPVCSSVKLGRNKEEGTLSEEHYVQDDYTAYPFFEDISGDSEGTGFGKSSSKYARQSTITPRTLNFNDEAGPSSPIRPTQNIEPKEQFKVDEVLADISRPRGLSIPWSHTILNININNHLSATDPKDKGKGILEEEEKDGRNEEKQTKDYFEETYFIAHERNHSSTLLISPDGEYLIIHRANNHFRAFDTLWEILHILDRQDLYHLYQIVQDYYEHIPPTGLGLILLGDLTTIWETAEISDDDFWKNQEDWEIVRWRLNESSGVHTLELEDGTMIHMLAERRYSLSESVDRDAGSGMGS
ncbi:hypothetical protein Tco_1131526 [Tanacetum coccineum]